MEKSGQGTGGEKRLGNGPVVAAWEMAGGRAGGKCEVKERVNGGVIGGENERASGGVIGVKKGQAKWVEIEGAP